MGGLIKTKEEDDPFAQASLEVLFETSSGSIIRKKEVRTIYSTKVSSIDVPRVISLSNQDDLAQIEVKLHGRSTVFISITESEESEVKLGLPDNVLSALEKLSKAFISGVESIREKYPQHEDLFRSVLEPRDYLSLKEINDELSEKIKDASSDEVFIEELKASLVSAFLSHVSVREIILLPLIEYFEASADTNIFFEAPFLCASVPTGTKTLSCDIELMDLHRRKSNRPSKIQVVFKNEGDQILIPLKEIIKVMRD